MIRLLFVLLLLSVAPLHCRASSAEATSSATSSSPKDDILGLRGISPDPFVAASPLIVAAVCRDGIAMVAVHTVSTEEKLLREFPQEEDKEKRLFADLWKDLPANHGGPYRINKIDRCGTYLMTAGWRADCDFLLEKIRSIAAQEVAVFGTPQSALPYGRLLAQDASLWMAHVAVSEQLRPLSCVGLLCNPSGQEDDEGSLWFVDVIGAYQVKALAIGGGKADGKEDMVVAQLVNAQLQATDFSAMTAKEGVVCILKILAGKKDVEGSRQLVPSGCDIEAAFIGQSKAGVIERLKVSLL